MEQLPSFVLLTATCKEGLKKLLEEASQADKDRIKILEEELKEKDKIIQDFHDKNKNYEKYKALYQNLLIQVQPKGAILEAGADLMIDDAKKTIEGTEKATKEAKKGLKDAKKAKKEASDFTALVVKQPQPSPPEVLAENAESLVGDTSAGHLLE